MPETEIAVWFNLDGPPHFFRTEHRAGKSSWQVTQHNGVDLLMIRVKERSHIRHAIPLSNVLYWTVASASDRVQSEESVKAEHLYCFNCRKNFLSVGGVLGTCDGHAVKRLCCNTSVYGNHDPTCATVYNGGSKGHGDHQSQPGDETVVGGVVKLHPSEFINIRGKE